MCSGWGSGRVSGVSEALDRVMEELASGALRVVDLTQPLGPETPVIDLPEMFAASPGVTIETISKYDEKGPAWYWNTIRMGEHTGTHFDAPVHWITGRQLPNNTTDTIPAGKLVGPACVFDARDRVAANPDYLFSPADLAAWEGTHDMVPAGSWALLCSGWSARHTREEFLNVHGDGPHSPGLHPDTVRALVARDVLGVGVETVGTDAGQAGGFDPPFPTHALMQGAGKFGLASLCNLNRLPPTGAIVIAAPLKIVGGSGSPLRVIALAPASS